MKLKSLLTTLAAAVGLTTAAVGATPLVTWNGDLAKNSVKNGFTMTFGSNAAESSGSAAFTAATSGSENTGVAIDWDSATFSGQTMTVLVKYSGMKQSGFTGNTALVGTYWGSSDKSTETLVNANDTMLKMAYNVTSSNSGNNGTYWTRSAPEEGLMRVTFSSSGTHLTISTGSDGAWTKGPNLDINCTNIDGLKKSASFYGLKIGGSIASTSSYFRPGMTVSAVSILDSDITDEELAAFTFPSDKRTYKSVLSLNFGASTYNVASGTTPLAVVDDNNWYNFNAGKSGSGTAGGVTVTYGGSGNYQNTGKTPAYLKGYLDDNGANVTFTIGNLTGPAYDVIIYCSSDNASGWSYKTVNGVNYTALANGEATVGTSTWGANTVNFAVLGMNAMIVKGVAPDSEGKISITSIRNSGYRGCVAAIQLGGLDAVVPKEFALTMSADAFWQSASWDPKLPDEGMAADATATVTVNATSPTLTLNGEITCGTLKVVSDAGKMLTIKKDPAAKTSFGVLGVSAATDGTAWDGRENTFTACNALLTAARTVDNKFYFYGTDDNGSVLDYGTAQNNYTFSGHYIFDGGTHTFQNASEGATLQFGANATVDNPTFWVKDNTTLNFKSRNPCGWNATASDAGIVRIGDNATVIAKDADADAGTWYWSQQFYLEHGATLEIGTTGDNFRTVGNDSTKPHFVVPAGAEATIEGGESNYLTLPSNSYGAMTFNVGDKSTLTVSANLKTRANGKPFVKYGEGTLKLMGTINNAAPAVQVMEGTLEIATSTDFASGATITNAATIAFSADEDSTFATAITGEGSVVKSGMGTLSVTPGQFGDNLVTIAGGVIQFTINDEEAEEGVTLFSTTQEITGIENSITVVNKAGDTVPGNLTKDDNAVKFKASLAHFTANITGDVTWSTKAGLSDYGSWISSPESTITLTNTIASATVNFDEATEAKVLKIVSAGGFVTVIPYDCFAKLTVATFDFSEALGGVEIDFDGASEEETLLVDGKAITGTDNVKAINLPEGMGLYVSENGISLRKTANTTYVNPVVTTEEKTFAQSFFGTEDAAWDTLANWRKAEGGLWIPATVIPGKQDGGYGPLVLDGNMTDEKTVTAAELEGWTPQYALYNGMNVTVTKLVKMQTDNKGFIWVDDSSSITFNTSGGNNHGTLALAVANDNGVTFTQKWSAGDNTISYYLTGNGSVNYAAGVSAGTHKIAQLDVDVGDTAKAAKSVVKGPALVKFGATSSVTFGVADDITAKSSDPSVTPVYTNVMPTAAMDIGTYTIVTEADGVYAYVVQHSDTWDIVDPLAATLTANTAFGDITWTDACGNNYATPTDAHAFELTAGEYTATFDDKVVAGSTIALKSGTLEVATADIVTNATLTIDEGATLSVKASGLKASQVTNNGTIAFQGGTSDDPIAITCDANRLGVVTLAADTYVRNTVTTDGNKDFKVTGQGASSKLAFTRSDGGVGFGTASSMNNLTIVGALPSGEKLWVERGIGENVRLVANGQIHLNGLSPTVLSLAGTSSVTRAGSETLTINCEANATYSGASSVPFTIGAGDGVQTLSGAYTGALTVNEGATVVLGGSAKPSSIVNNGTVKYLKVYDLGAGRACPSGTYVFTQGVTATQTRQEYAKGEVSSFTGFTEGTKITLTKLDGTSEELTVDAEGKASSTAGGPQIAGPACLFDVTFTNKEDASQFAYKAVSATLQYDSTATFYDPEKTVKDIGVYIKHHPYINGAASTFNALGDFTAVFVGTMSPTANRIFVHFGSSYYSDAKGIMIATKEGTDKVGVFSNVGSTLEELKDLSVPNAATARHVYIVTKKTVGEDTVFTIYLDGVKRAEKTIEGSFVLGTSGHCGVQVGADFGGLIREYTDYKAIANVDTETGVLNVCRIYDYLLTDDQVTKITTEYPYISEGGLYERSVTGAADYSATKAWTKSSEETAEYDVPTGSGDYKPSATLTATGDGATITVNTNSLIDTFTFNGSAMSFLKDTDGTNKITVSTAVINAPVTIRYNVLDLRTAAISLSGTGALTFDFQDFDLAGYFEDAKIQITGLVDQNDTKITAINIPTVAGRSATFAYDDGEYYLTVTVDKTTPFIYTIAAEEETGTWTFGEGGTKVTEEIVKQYTTYPVWKEGAGTLTNMVINRTYLVKEGTMVAGDANEKTGTVTVDAGATFDFNGKANGYTTIILNGGSLVNNGGEMGTYSRQIEGITLTDNSTIGGTGNFGLVSNGYGANTLDLGGKMLTKTGGNTFWLCHTTVTNGTLNVTAGAISVVNGETTFTNDAALVLGKGTTLNVADKLNIAAITADGATINNTGTISGFTLTGSATLTGDGTWGTITNETDAVASIGTKRGLTFAGAGTVNVTLTAEEFANRGVEQTIFTTDTGATTKVGTVLCGGEDVTSQCSISGGKITVKKHPTIYFAK